MKSGSRLRIERSIGNNVVLARNVDGAGEYILLGKGLGFGAKPGTMLDADDSRVEKRYRLDDQASGYNAVFEAIDPEVADISMAIIEQLERDFGTAPNPRVYVALPSHIQFAVHRLRSGIDILNPHLQETRTCYPREYEAARQAGRLIADKFGIHVPEDEVGFLTLHVQSAIGSASVGQLMKVSNLISELVEHFEQLTGLSIDRSSPDYVRLAAHLRFFFERVAQDKTETNPFLNEIRTQYGDIYSLASELAAIAQRRLDKPVTPDEIGYLAMHLYRLLQKKH